MKPFPRCHSLNTLPKWAREMIEGLRRDLQIERRNHRETMKAHAITSDGREWFTLRFNLHDFETIFRCDRQGTQALFSLRRGDMLMVGRKPRKEIKPPAPDAARKDEER